MRYALKRCRKELGGSQNVNLNILKACWCLDRISYCNYVSSTGNDLLTAERSGGRKLV